MPPRRRRHSRPFRLEFSGRHVSNSHRRNRRRRYITMNTTTINRRRPIIRRRSNDTSRNTSSTRSPHPSMLIQIRRIIRSRHRNKARNQSSQDISKQNMKQSPRRRVRPTMSSRRHSSRSVTHITPTSTRQLLQRRHRKSRRRHHQGSLGRRCLLRIRVVTHGKSMRQGIHSRGGINGCRVSVMAHFTRKGSRKRLLRRVLPVFTTSVPR